MANKEQKGMKELVIEEIHHWEAETGRDLGELDAEEMEKVMRLCEGRALNRLPPEERKKGYATWCWCCGS